MSEQPDIGRLRLDQRLKQWPIPPLEQSYRRQDAALYALSVGAGDDPGDAGALRHILQENVEPLPTFPTTLAANSPWLFDPANGIDSASILLRELSITLHDEIASEGTVVFHERVDAVWDRGQDRGAILHLVGPMQDKTTGRTIATIERVTIALRNGGFGGLPPPAAAPRAWPERAPDAEHLCRTRADGALLFRLHGDLHRLHWDTAFAAERGFPKPLLHGMCTLGIVCNAVVKVFANYRSQQLRAIRMAFKAPVFPGDVLRTEFWRDGADVLFRAFVDDRSVVIADGQAVMAEDDTR